MMRSLQEPQGDEDSTARSAAGANNHPGPCTQETATKRQRPALAQPPESFAQPPSEGVRRSPLDKEAMAPVFLTDPVEGREVEDAVRPDLGREQHVVTVARPSRPCDDGPLNNLGAVMLIWLLVGCGQESRVFEQSTSVSPFFPFEAGRTWTYTSMDLALPGELVVTLDDEVDLVDELPVYTVAYDRVCEAPCAAHERMRLQWSNGPDRGVRIHSVSIAGERMDYLPPIQVALGRQWSGDAWVTPTGGRRWVSTFDGREPCEPAFIEGLLGCARFTLTHDGPDDALLPITSLVAAEGHGVTAMQLAGETEPWELTDLDCGTCDGQW